MDEKIDINRADVESLAALPGIGLKRAAKIVEYRTAVQPFEEVIELAAVPGISERMVREIANRITVNVEEIAIFEMDSGNGSGTMAETVMETAAETEAETASGMEKEETGEEAETAEPEVEPIAAEAEMGEAEIEEPPVVVTMLNGGQERPETEAAPETAAEGPVVAAPPSPEVTERRVVETVQGRHFHFWQQFLGVMAGVLIGSSLTLLLLLLLNGTLRFAGESQTASLQRQLEENMSDIRQSQSDLVDEMGELAGQVVELDNDLAASEDAIGAVEEDVAGLAETTVALNERLETINLAAEKFDNFMTGLRDLLVAIQGLPPAPTATTTISGTATLTTTVTPEATAVTPTVTPSPMGTVPEGGAPTRTPRPTVTPLFEPEN